MPSSPRRASTAAPATVWKTFFSSAPEVAEALRSPRLNFLNDSGLSIVFIKPEQLHNARRLIEEGARRNGVAVLYLHDDEEYRLLDSDSSGGTPPIDLPAVPPRPLTKMRDPDGKGGILLLNTSQISSAYVEGDNNAMDKAKGKLRVICLCTEDAIHNGSLSEALISRAHGSYFDLSDFKLPEFPDPEPKRADELKDPYIVDLQGKADDWETSLHGGLAFNEDNKLALDPGHLTHAKGRPILLENPPENQHRLRDLVALSQHSGPKIYFAAEPSDKERREKAKNKGPAENIEKLLTDRTPDIHVLNLATLESLIDKETIFDGGKPKRLPSILKREKDAKQIPTLYVTESLEELDWHRLMGHKTSFRIAAGPGVDVPKIYKDRIARHDRRLKPTSEPFFSHPVAFVKSRDPRMIDSLGLPADIVRIDLEPTDGAHTLVSTLVPLEAGRWEVKRQRLLQALIDGKQVVVTGLENNFEIRQELDTLWQCRYLMHNGRRYHFGANGGLTGSVLVLTDSDELVKTSPSAVLHTDPVANLQQWEKLALEEGLPSLKEFSHVPEELPKPTAFLKTHYQHILALQEILVHQGLVAPTKPPFNYQKLVTVFRHTVGTWPALPSDLNQWPPAQQQQWFLHHRVNLLTRSLSIENQLIGNLPRTRPLGGSKEPEQTGAYFRICARMTQPGYMERMPAQSFDLPRLRALLARTHHEDAMLSNPWDFLDCFGFEVLQAIFGKTLPDIVGKLSNKHEVEKEIGKTVLSLVMGVARRYGIWLQPWLLENADAWAAGSFAPDLPTWQNPLVTSTEWINEHIARKLLEKSNMLFLVGDPGAGKTHLGKKLTEGDPQFRHATHYVASVADYEEAEFDRIIEAFLNDPGMATLRIDEVNLLDKHALNKLRAATLNLPPHKRIIVMGNDDDTVDRELPQIINDAMAVYRCESMPPRELKVISVDPILEHLQAQPPLTEEERSQIANHAINMYQRMQSTFPSLQQSQRALSEYMLQLVYVMREKSLRTLDKDSLRQLGPYINYIARQVYADALPEADRRNAELWLNSVLGEIRQDMIDTIAPIPKGLFGKDKPLADTPKARKLAQSICWWIKMLEWRKSITPAPTSGPTGLVALFKEGPPGIGKDKIIAETLKMLGYRFIHLNARASNPVADENEVRKAIKQKVILLFSEANVHKSGTLESWLNEVLTKWPSGFGLIITANDDDTAGRQRTAAPFLDRTIRAALPDNDGDDWDGLTENFGEQNTPDKRRLSQQLGRLQIVSPPGSGRQGESSLWKRKPEEVRNAFVDKWKKLKTMKARHLPGARQLRNAFNAPSSLTAQEAVDRACGILELIAKHAPTTAQTGTEDEAAIRLRTYEQILRLTNPQWLSYPSLRKLSDLDPDSKLPANTVTVYSAHDNILYIDTNQPPPRVATYLIRVYNGQLYHPNAPTVHLLNQAGLNAARKKAQSQTLPPGVAPNMRPAAMRSGIGTKQVKGIMGYLTDAQNEQYYFPAGKGSVHHDGGALLPLYQDRRFDNHKPASIPHKMELFSTSIQDGRIYLGELVREGIQKGTLRPTEVEIDDKKASEVWQDEWGCWYVPTNLVGPCKVTHGFVEELIKRPAYTSDKLGRIDLAWPEDVRNLITRLRDCKDSLPPQTIAAQVKKFLSPPSFRHRRDKAELATAQTRAEKNTHFLKPDGREGVCAEFSDAFAFIMEAIGFNVLCVAGRTSHRGDIPVERHRWNQIDLPDGSILTVDATPLEFLPRTGLDAGTDGEKTNASATAVAAEHGNDARHLETGEVRVELMASADPVLEKSSLKELGLTYHQPRKGKIHTASVTSDVDPDRYARNNPKMFRKKKIGEGVSKPKALVLTPPIGSRWLVSKSNSFQLGLAISGLQELGVHVFYGGKQLRSLDEGGVDELFEKLKSDQAAQRLRHEELELTRLKKKYGLSKQQIQITDASFCDRLVSHYYECLLETKSALLPDFLDDERQGVICQSIAKHWHNTVASGIASISPAEVRIGPHRLKITRDILERALISKIEDGTVEAPVTDLFEFLSDADNKDIDLEVNPFVKKLDELIDDPNNRDEVAEEIKKRIDEIEGAIDSLTLARQPERLRQWATDKLKRIEAFESDQDSD